MKKLYPALLCFFCWISASAQKEYRGHLENELGQNLPSVQGTAGSSTTTTDALGNFSFSYNADSVLVTFSAGGYTPRSILLFAGQFEEIKLERNILALQTATVYAYNSNNTIQNTAASVQILNKKDLVKYGDQSFVQAMNEVPGVKMDERSPGSYRLAIRSNLLRSAFGVRNVKIYLNDLPYTDASGNSYLNILAPNNIEKVEIVKGPGGSMYGAGTGGLLFLETNSKVVVDPSAAADREAVSPLANKGAKVLGVPSAAADRGAGSVSVTAGNYGTYSATGNSTFTSKNTTHHIAASLQKTNGYRDQTYMQRQNINYSFTAKKGIHDFAGLVFAGNLHYGTPGGLTKTEKDANPAQARPAAGAFRGAVEQKASIHLQMLYMNFSDRIKINYRLSNFTGVYFSPDELINPTIRNYENKKETGVGGRTVFEYALDNIKTSFGAEYQNSNVNTATYGNRKGVKDTLQFHDYIRVRQLNIFAQSVFSLPLQFTLTAGVSYNRFYYGYRRESDPASNDESGFTPQFIPRVTLLKKIKDLSIYGSYSKGYSPPTIDEIHASDGIFNKGLSPEKSENYEAGVKYSAFKNRINFSADYFINPVKQTIVRRTDASGSEYFLNAGSTKLKGWEFYGNFVWLRKENNFFKEISNTISYTQNKGFFQNYKQGNIVYTNKRLTGTPYSTFSLSLQALMDKGFSIESSLSYNDKTPLNDANTFYEEAYSLLSVRVNKTIKVNKSEVSLILFSRKSLTGVYSPGDDLNAAGNRYYNPGAPFTFSGGVSVKF